MSILWITLAVLAGAFIVGGTAAYFFRARYLESVEATASNLQSVAAPVPVADEVRAIGDQIERAMTESRLQGETQRQLLAQKLDSVRQSVETQRHHVDGIRNELRHEIRRRDVEMSEIRTQISTISTTIGLPAPAPPQAALPPAAPAPEASSGIPALADPALAPPPAFPGVGFGVPADDAVAFETAPAEFPEEESPFDSFDADEPSMFEPVSFAPPHPAPTPEAPAPEPTVAEPVATEPAAVEPIVSETEADVESPVAMPVEDVDRIPPFVIDPVGDAERDAAEAAAGWMAAPEAPTEPSAPAMPEDTADWSDEESFSFEDLPLAPALGEPMPEPADDTPVPFETNDIAGDSFAEVSFEDLSFAAPAPVPSGPPPDLVEEDSTFESWTPAPPPAAEAPVSEAAAPPAETPEERTPSADALGPWVARSGREEADGSTFSFGEPVHASASDFLPPAIPEPASEPAEAAEAAEAEFAEPEADQPVAESPAGPEPEAAPVPDHADDLTVLSNVDEHVQGLLFAEGVYTLDQIAQMSRTTARRVSRALQVSEETIMTQWVFEAQSALFTPFASGGSR